MSKSDSFEQAIQEQREADAAARSGEPTVEEPPSAGYRPRAAPGPTAGKAGGGSHWDGGIFLGVAVGLAGMALVAMVLGVLWLPGLVFGWGWTSFYVANGVGALVSMVGLALSVAAWRALSSR